MLVYDVYVCKFVELDPVLILILLDVGLWLIGIRPDMVSGSSLNPYSIGCWSMTGMSDEDPAIVLGVLILILLDVGLWPSETFVSDAAVVLILILLDVGLWQRLQSFSGNTSEVLILILLDVGLWLPIVDVETGEVRVLILILLDVGLWPGFPCLIW